MPKMNLQIDLDTIKEDVTKSAEAQIKEHLEKIAKAQVHSDYELGIFIKEHTSKWIRDNLKEIVLKELQTVNIKQKVEQAVERAVMDIVHNQLKNIKL